jgi:xylulokinase
MMQHAPELMGPIAFSVPLIKIFESEDAVRRLLSGSRIAGQPATRRISIADAVASPDALRFRCMLEALAWNAKDFFARMGAAGIATGPIYATGGWARSRALMELRASIFGVTITAIHEPEMTALGAALFASEAVANCPPDFVAHREIDVFEPVAEWRDTYMATDIVTGLSTN